MSYVYREPNDKTDHDVVMEFLHRKIGKELAISFVDSRGQKPEPINVTLDGVDFENGVAVITIPLDSIYSIDTELY